MKYRILILFFLTGFWLIGYRPVHAKSKCTVPAICFKMRKQFEKSKQDPRDEKKFNKLIALARQASKPTCRIKGVRPFVEAYIACYDQVLTLKNGRRDQSFEGVIPEDEVFKWFEYIDESKFPEGRRFIESDLFTSSLDGYWAERFMMDE